MRKKIIRIIVLVLKNKVPVIDVKPKENNKIIKERFIRDFP